MTARAYLSNLSKLWPLERQEALHAERTPGWPDDVTVYRDKLGPTLLKAHAPSSLADWANLLRPTSRRPNGETIYLASLAVLAWESEDFMGALAAAAKRHAAVVVLDTGRRIEPDAGAAELAEALSEFRASRRKEQTGDARKAAAAARVAKQRAELEKRLALIREDWRRRDYSTEELLLRAGRKRKRDKKVTPLSYATASLQPRPVAQREYEAGQKRAAARKAKAHAE